MPTIKNDQRYREHHPTCAPAQPAGHPTPCKPISAVTAAPCDLADKPSAVVLRYEQFRTDDPVAARLFFARAYSPGWRIDGLTTGSAVTHSRWQAGSMTLDEVLIQDHVSCEIAAIDSVVVIQPRTGPLSVTAGESPTLDWPLLVAPGLPCVLRGNSVRFEVVIIALDVLHRVAADGSAPLPQRIQFQEGRPRSRAAVRAWHRALDYVTATLTSPDSVQQPMLADAMAPLLATVLLECYPSNVTAEHDLLGDPAASASLRDAVAFIHVHAAGGVGIKDIAAAVHLTPRAVQYLFRHQLDTTPTEYLRRVRLHRAHQDLRASDRSVFTVAQIAQRWGFVHTGRFAVLYRQTYGQSPHTTLRE